MPFTPITLVCRDLSYYVDDPSRGEALGVVKGGAEPGLEGKLQLLKVRRGAVQRGGALCCAWRRGAGGAVLWLTCLYKWVGALVMA